MRQPILDRNFAIAAAAIIVVIIYGSLYPFAFRVPRDGIGPVHMLLSGWAIMPGRGDFLSNILFYSPLGFFGRHAIRPRLGTWLAAILVVLFGAGLSITMELAQYYDVGRVTSATDVYSNVLGTLLGTTGSRVIGGNLGGLLRPDGPIDRAPPMLLTAWIAYRLYPYVPSTALNKYWHALKPVVLHPSLTPYHFFRQTAIWLTIGALIEGMFGSRRSRKLFPIFAALVMFAQILIIDSALSVAEIAGAAAGLFLWFAFGVSVRLRVLASALLLGTYVVALRLEPFQFRAEGGAFGWIPFMGFMNGSINVDVMSFLEKFFLYGSLVWLLDRTGFRLRTSTIFVAAILFATSWAETHLPGRSAEITDALIAVATGGIIALVRTDTGEAIPGVEQERAASAGPWSAG